MLAIYCDQPQSRATWQMQLKVNSS
jgi:hypothetical protein